MVRSALRKALADAAALDATTNCLARVINVVELTEPSTTLSSWLTALFSAADSTTTSEIARRRKSVATALGESDSAESSLTWSAWRALMSPGSRSSAALMALKESLAGRAGDPMVPTLASSLQYVAAPALDTPRRSVLASA